MDVFNSSGIYGHGREFDANTTQASLPGPGLTTVVLAIIPRVNGRKRLVLAWESVMACG
jgi:hypothetical protein